MVNKFIVLTILLFSFVACNGAKIEFTKPEMESTQIITTGEGIIQPGLSGTLVRPSVNDGTDKIVMNGKTYQVGKYSSAGAYSFIYAKELGSHTNVKLSGNTTKDSGYAPSPSANIDVINIETISAQ